MERKLSEKAFAEACKYIPGGVDSPVRAFKNVGGTPFFVKKAKGSKIRDIDGNNYIDFCLSWGVFILGHANQRVNKKIKEAVGRGSSYGIPCTNETLLAKKINKHFPSIEKIRFVNSGTEAVMSALRLARAYTKRKYILKFDGCYHGHSDHLLVSAGSGVVNLPSSSSDGVPDDFTRYTISLPFNDEENVRKIFEEKGKEIAALIVEPVPANMGVVIPKDGYLSFLKEITARYGSLLIFDEVITGFRFSIGGAQKTFGIKPDLTTLGKIIGGGFPAAAFGGRKDIMDLLSPEGNVYQAGTLSGNPVAMAAGIETLKCLEKAEVYEKLNKKSEVFLSDLKGIVENHEIQLNHIGPMFSLFFTPNKVESFEDVRKCDEKRFSSFFHQLLEKGIYFSPSPYETDFISVSHTPKDLEYVLDTVKKVLA